jgi:protein-S-isoprenylcysteine O-methyltransferase Ste14
MAQAVLFVTVAAALVWDGTTDASVVLVAAGVIVAAAGGLLASDGVLRIRRHISAMPAPVAGAPLVEAGSYALVRHPIYGGLTLATLGLAVARASLSGLAAGVALGIFFALKSGREERMLRAAYAGYDAYARRVQKRLVPWIY